MSASGAPVDPKAPEGSSLHDKKLVSWKEIAVHLGREIRTVQRWEKTEGLPVRRHEHQKRSTVYAYASELDEWFKKRQPADDPAADAAFEPEPDVADGGPESEDNDAILATQPPAAVAQDDSVARSRARRKRLATRCPRRQMVPHRRRRRCRRCKNTLARVRRLADSVYK